MRSERWWLLGGNLLTSLSIALGQSPYSRQHRRRFQFLVKWKGFSREHNSWEVASNIKALDLVMEYYWKHPAAPRHIHQTDFDAIFNPGTIALRRSNLGEGVNIRGPLTHDPRAPSIASQHNFIMQPLATKEWNARTFQYIYYRLFLPEALSNSLRNLLEVSCNIFHSII